MIEINNLNYNIGKKEIIKNLHLRLEKKKIALIGSNGSGKSSLLRIIKGLIKEYTGSIKINGINNELFTQKIGFIFQNPDSQIIFPIVEEDILFGLKKFKISKETIDYKITNILNKFDLLHLKKANTHKLSGGEKQMIALAGMLVLAPEILLFDEPTTFLDLKNKNRFVKLIFSLPQLCIIATHDLDLASRCDEAILLENGQLQLQEDSSKVIEHYKQVNKDTYFPVFGL